MEKRLLMAILAMVFALATKAQETFSFSYEGSTLLYEVTKNGSVKECGVKGLESASNEIIIPDNVKNNGKTYKVTSILNYAFWNCDELKYSIHSVTLPNSITAIEDYAFADCRNLYTVTIPNSVETIGNYAFYQCTYMESITLPNSIQKIGDYAFAKNDLMTSVALPNSVKEIGCNPFANWMQLETISVDENNKYFTIYDDCLYNIDLTEIKACPTRKQGNVTIPESVTLISGATFSGCSKLTSITVPESVTAIGEYAFYGCSQITSINIPKSLTTIENRTFSGCSQLSSVIFPENITSIGEYAFSGCINLTSVVLPENVSSIGESAFWYCRQLTSIKLPNSLTNIEQHTFSGCSSLTSITIPKTVERIHTYAFLDCTALTSVYFDASITTTIDYNAFMRCTNIKEVYNSSNDPCYGDRFPEEVYVGATLYVPVDAIEIYKSRWSEFFNIKGYDFTGVETIEADITPDAKIDVYDFNGIRVADSLNDLNPGLYIIRQGKNVKKISIK